MLTQFRSKALFVADYAVVENGKVYASGAFWATVRFPAFPAVLPMMSLVAVIEIPFNANFAEHTFGITLIDQDEKPTSVRVEGVFRSAPTIEQKFGAPTQTPFAVPIQGLKIERPGEYTFVLAVDGKELARYTFSAVQVATVAMPAAPNPPAS